MMGSHAQGQPPGPAAAHYARGEYKEALEKYRVLAERGSAPAQVRVGWMYHTGRGVGEDREEARRWYKAAADTGSALGQFYLARLYLQEKDYATGLEFLGKAASQNYTPALARLGDLYDRGLAGVKRDREKALQYYQQAATGGHVIAQKRIALRMIRGQLGLLRIPQGFYALAPVLWSAFKLLWRDPYDERTLY